MMGNVYVVKTAMQGALRFLFPPRCVGCGEMVVSDFGLCANCWRDTPFTAGLVCDACGIPLPGGSDGESALCDDCLANPRPWERGRSAFVYSGKGREMVLSFKHADRLDLVKPMAEWLARAVRPIVRPTMIIAPVPMHWSRLMKRRYNQSALLARALAEQCGLRSCPDLLIRVRKTSSQDGKDRDARQLNVAAAIRPHPRRLGRLAGADVLLVDDVMTSGATLAAATEACFQGGANHVCVAALARVAKDV